MPGRVLKDPFSSLSHGFGLALSLVGIGFLIESSRDRPQHLAAFDLYGLGLVSLYSASAVYHAVQGRPWLRKLDHSAIYLMIAGSYAPLCQIALHGPVGSRMMVAQAAFAVAGVALTFLLKKVPGPVRVTLYLSMGWMAVLAIPTLSQRLPGAALGWLFAGGVFYTVGAVVYVLDRPKFVKGLTAHDLWHVLVLAGSACHFVLMARYISALT